jgi:hypothetical protein
LRFENRGTVRQRAQEEITYVITSQPDTAPQLGECFVLVDVLPVDADVFLGNYSLDPIRLDRRKNQDGNYGNVAEAQDCAAADAHRDSIVFRHSILSLS